MFKGYTRSISCDFLLCKTDKIYNLIVCLCCCTDDAKRLAIKEENVDPEYENCGGAHEDAKQSTSYCNIPHTKDTGEQ